MTLNDLDGLFRAEAPAGLNFFDAQNEKWAAAVH